MKNLKGGGEYVTPNVSLIANDNSVMFNPVPPPELITFTVILGNGGFTKTYTAEKGMTWENWINCGKYDITCPGIYGHISIQEWGDYMYVSTHISADSSSYFLNLPDGSRLCLPTDIIEDGATYTAKGEK